MKGPLGSYLRRMLLSQTLGMLIALAALMQVLDLLDATTDILKRHLGLRGVLHYAALRTPAELSLALPLASLLGALFMFYTLAKRRELTAIRATGVSLRSVVIALLPVPLLFAVCQFWVTDQLVPQSETALAAWWNSTTPPPGNDDDDASKTTLWAHTHDGLAAFDRISGDGRHITGLHLYRRGADTQFDERLEASTADWDGTHWHLGSMRRLKLAGDRVTRDLPADDVWPTNLRPDDLLRLDSPQPQLSSTVLIGVLAGARVGARPASYYHTALYRRFTAPLAPLIMLLLALPATRAASRSGEGGGLLLVSLGAGLLFVLIDGLLAALGQGDRLPPLAASAAPLILFAGLGLAILHRYDST
jgi:lipopolysaccharide export system permease protein